MTARESALFVFAPALYAKTPFQGKWAFLHGTLTQKNTQQGNEQRFVVEDAKGKWEGYAYAITTSLEEGQTIRAYGQLKVQPDGNCKAALQWMKTIEGKEKQFIEAQTQTQWKELVEKFPQLPLLQPFESKPIQMQERATQTKPVLPQQEEFIPASELKVEQDYV